jgi:hypothetical protein
MIGNREKTVWIENRGAGRENEIVGYEKLGYVVKGRSVAYYSNTSSRVGVKKGFRSMARRSAV